MGSGQYKEKHMNGAARKSQLGRRSKEDSTAGGQQRARDGAQATRPIGIYPENTGVLSRR